MAAHRRRQPASGPAGSAMRSPHRAGTTASPAHCTAGALLKALSASRWERIAAFSAFINSRCTRQRPPRSALRADRAFPATVRGPVVRSHGRLCLMTCACCFCRSGVQPFFMGLQHFGFADFAIFRARGKVGFNPSGMCSGQVVVDLLRAGRNIRLPREHGRRRDASSCTPHR